MSTVANVIWLRRIDKRMRGEEEERRTGQTRPTPPTEGRKKNAEQKKWQNKEHALAAVRPQVKLRMKTQRRIF